MRRKLTRLSTILVAAAAITTGMAGPASADILVANGYKVCPNGKQVRIFSTHSPPRVYTEAKHVFYSSSNDPWITWEHKVPFQGGTIRTRTDRQAAYWRVYDNLSLVTNAGAECVPL